MRFFRAALALVLLSSVFAFAQSESATLSGRVTDPTGAVVPGTDVTAFNVDTGVSNAAKTNDAGVYSFAQLRPGTYRLTLRAAGFRQLVQNGIVLHVQDRTKLDFALQVGSTEQTVTVSSEIPLVNSESASVGTVVERDFVANMPLNGRSIQALIQLTPSVVVTPVSSGSSGQFSINGQRPDSNYFTVDGASANVGVAGGGSVLAAASGSGTHSTASGGYSNLASIDAIQEFKIQTSSFAPEFGRTPGGQVSIVTKSGTNAFHGDAFEYLRNNIFDANDWFLNGIPPRAGVPQHPPERQNDFGAVLGGPIWKNKAFFFFSYEGLRLTQPTPILKYVPSLCQRGTGPCPTGAQPAIAAARPYLIAYPLPTVGGCGNALAPSADPLLSPFCQGYPATVTQDNYSLRGDYNISSKLNVFARWVHAPSTSDARSANATSLFTNQPDWDSYTAGLNYSIVPTVLNSFNFNYTFAKGYAHSTLDAFAGAVPFSTTDPIIFPNITTPDGQKVSINNTRVFITYTPAVAWRIGEETKNEAHQWGYIDTLSWTKGAHQMKFGVDFRRLTPIQARPPYQQSFTFQTTAQMNAGTPQAVLSAFFPLTGTLYYQTSVFAQDTWKLTPRLTFTYGLRWEYNPPPGTINNVPFLGFTQFDRSNLAGTQVASIGKPIYETQKNAFAPRLGIAYQLSRDPNWGRVLRAGWGLFFDTTGDYASMSTVNGPQFTFGLTGAASTTACGRAVFPPTPCMQDPRNVNPNPNQAPWPNITSQDPHIRLPYTYEMNVALEQSLGSMQSLSLTYAGAVARNLFVLETFAAPNTNLPSGFQVITNSGTSDYHSLQVLFNRRLSHGMQTMASYNYAHSIDTGSVQSASIPNVAVQPISRERASSDFDIRHSFQAALTYNIPAPVQNRAAKAILGGWGSDFMFRARSAPPVNIVTNVNWSQFAPNTNIAERPNIVAGQPFYLFGSACAAFYHVASCPGGWGINKAAFSNPVAGTQGSLARNHLRGFGFNELDATIRRQFNMTERLNLQFRADIFNVLNTPAFGFAANNLNTSNGAFGLSSAMLANSLFVSGGLAGFNPLYQIGAPRSMQLSLKLVF